MSKKIKYFYVCGTDWDLVLGETDFQGYASLDLLKESVNCWDECGVVKVKASLDSVVVPPNMDLCVKRAEETQEDILVGYDVSMELRNVTFNKKYIPEVRALLKDLNISWHKKSDWCRFDSSLEDISEIFEDIGFATSDEGDFIEITDFERSRLGSQEKMFETLAPYLSDCEIVYYGEDNIDWKQVITKGTLSKEERDTF